LRPQFKESDNFQSISYSNEMQNLSEVWYQTELILHRPVPFAAPKKNSAIAMDTPVIASGSQIFDIPAANSAFQSITTANDEKHSQNVLDEFELISGIEDEWLADECLSNEWSHNNNFPTEDLELYCSELSLPATERKDSAAVTPNTVTAICNYNEYSVNTSQKAFPKETKTRNKEVDEVSKKRSFENFENLSEAVRNTRSSPCGPLSSFLFFDSI